MPKDKKSTNTPIMRAATPMERVGDKIRDVYESVTQQPLVQLADKLGLSDIGGVVKSFSNPSQMKMGTIPVAPPGAGILRNTPTKMQPSTISNEFHMADEVEKLIQGMGGPKGKIQILDESNRPLLNASGESMASAEALSRMKGMRDRGQKYVVRKGGTTRELIGPEAVDYNPRSGEQYGILDADGLFRLLQGQ